jgi:hypothetical protein
MIVIVFFVRRMTLPTDLATAPLIVTKGKIDHIAVNLSALQMPS